MLPSSARAAAVALILLSGRSAIAEETVRIAIVENAKQITLAGHGLEVRKLGVGEQYSASPGGRSAVYLSGESLMLDGAEVNAPDGLKFRSNEFVRVADKPVRGQIEIRRHGKGLIAINVVPLEDYLAAVLGSEMPRSFPLEALKAQAVAARTYALQRKIRGWGRPYHLGATVLHQVYGGAKSEDPITRDVVRATTGEVLVFRMEPIEAYFHSSCGGRTETGVEALGQNMPYLKAVECPCGEAKSVHWTYRLPLSELSKLWPGTERIEVLERSPSGRVRKVKLGGRNPKVVSGVELRRRIGYEKLRSLDFEVRAGSKAVELSGKGFGHGAGLCQWGAKALAGKGLDYRSILAHYYPGAELRKMY